MLSHCLSPKIENSGWNHVEILRLVETFGVDRDHRSAYQDRADASPLQVPGNMAPEVPRATILPVRFLQYAIDRLGV